MKLFQFLSLCLILTLASCSRNSNKALEVDPAFGAYISGYTAGTISKANAIRIRLAADYPGEIKLNEPLKEKYFSFSPSIKGKTYWLDSRTLEFVPDQHLPSATKYTASFELSQLMEVPDKFKTLNFSFSTRALGVFVKTNHPETYSTVNLSRQYIEGEFFVTDVADSAKVKKILSASQDGKPLKIQISSISENKYNFVVHNVKRSNALSKVIIKWDGGPLGTSFSGKKEINVPKLGQFFPTDISIEQTPEQMIKIHFSDPLDVNQTLLGLANIEGLSSLTTSITGHNLFIFPSYRVSDKKKVTVYAGIRNINGKKTSNERSELVTFQDIKPALRITGKGVIIPNTQGTIFPFEAVNIKAVEVHVTQIFEKNIVQFLQVNNLSGGTQLKRVGREVKVKTVRLDENTKLNLHEWNRFSLDISDIVKVEPGAIYNIELKFKKEHSVYECGSDADSEESMASIDTPQEEEWEEKDWGSFYDGYWNEGYEYEDYYYDGYDYSQRENPCNVSYYSNKSVSQNVLSSDLGIIAKAGTDKKLHVIISDLRTTEPIGGVTLEYYDFQQQLIGTAQTNKDGMIDTKLKSKPFILIAKKGNQRGYLTLRDGEALSVSKFDVGGATSNKGVKGFPYTERGVYRPGDSIFLSFMLEDKEKVLPQNHPVVMELRNPSGIIVQKIVRSKNVNGLYDFRTATLPEDPTGYWSTRFMVGNREFYQSIRVETIKPNRLKLYLDFGKDKLSALDENTTGKVSAKWLHGAPARNMNSLVEMTLNGGYTSFKNYEQYVFDNPTKTFTSQQMTLFDGTLDDNGEATFDVKINAGQNAPGMLKAFFTTRVFEKGGDFSIDQSSLTYSPYTHYVGVKAPEGQGYNNQLVTDKDHSIKIATVDANGKPASRNVEVKVYKVENHWWWDSYNNNDIMAFITNNGIVPHQSQKLTTSNGSGTFKLRVNKPLWGNFLVIVKDLQSNHTTGSQLYVDWPYGSRENETDKENATMLTFATDKKTYEVGEDVTVTIPSPAKGRALVSIECGTRIIEKSWIETTKGDTKYTFKATAEMAPTAYVDITLVQPHAQVKNDLPIRLYGIVPINVENKDSHLNPVITCAKEFKPESSPIIAVKEKDGKPMTYTLAIVDEGLLDLTNFKTPDPWTHFYSRDALGVKTWDVYDNVLGSYAVKMDELLAIGGDAEGGKDGESETKANRFKPMVYFAGPFKLEAGGNANHKVKIPNYVGSVRVMVVAGEDRAYGNSEKTVPVRSPLMVLATLPRVLGPGEEVELPVNVFAMEKHVKNVSIEIQANDMFTFKNGKSKSLNFVKPGDEVINFPCLVANKLGVGKVTVIARSGKEVAKHEIEIQVRSSNPKIMDAYETVLDPGKSWDANMAFNGLKGSNFASIEVSTVPPVNLGERLKYLIEYPHGCIEQTTSSAFPQLYLSKIMELDANFKKEIKKNIQATIKRISLFQTGSGGFSYWPGQSDASPWGTTYATHFLLEAEAAGYKVPSGLKNSALNYLKNKSRYFRVPVEKATENNTEYTYDYGTYSYDTYDQAYRLFVLALGKQSDLGAMNRLREYTKLATEEKWRLAAAYQLAGQSSVAKEITKGLSTKIPVYANPGYSFGSDVRDRAMILETMVIMKNKTAAALLARDLSKELNKDTWMSTQTTAYCLLAMSKFAGIANSSREINFTYNVNGNAVSKQVRNVMYQVKVDGNKIAAKSKLSVKNTGKGMLYVRVVVEKVPMAGDSITAVNNNINLAINYTTLDGSPLNVNEIEQGTDFVAEVSISNPGSRGYLTEMALNQIFASGWEIHNTRMDNFDAALQTDIVTYQDYRDDRVYSYYNIGASANKTIRVRLNAAYVGKYYLPTVTTEAMYDNSIYARVPGRWIKVVQPKKEESVAKNK